jgi:hypothetical protein
LAGFIPHEAQIEGKQESAIEQMVKKNEKDREDQEISKEARRIKNKYFKARKVSPSVSTT